MARSVGAGIVCSVDDVYRLICPLRQVAHGHTPTALPGSGLSQVNSPDMLQRHAVYAADRIGSELPAVRPHTEARRKMLRRKFAATAVVGGEELLSAPSILDGRIGSRR